MSSPLRTQFNNYMTLRGFSSKTKEAYVNAVAGLADYYSKSPDTLTCDQIQGYLLHLIEDRRLAWSSCNIAFCAFRCFYAKVLHWDTTTFSLPPRPRDRKLPVALSMEEVGRLLNEVHNPKHRALLMTVYGSGLRVSEAVALQLHHIEGSRKMIRVEQGKGRKDRYTVLPEYLLLELRAYWQRFHPAPWLFPDRCGSRPMPVGTAQKVYYQAKRKAGITKGFGIHTLRHCFATHLLDQGVDIYVIKRMMGHVSLRTTARYLHISTDKIRSVKSPLDLLYEQGIGGLYGKGMRTVTENPANG